MSRIYFPLILLIVFLISSTQAFSEEYQHDAVYHELKKEYKLNKDGSIEFHYYKKLEIKTHHAFHRLYGETFIVYNPEHQDLTINKSITTMADGTKVPAPDNAFNEVLPRQAKNAPAYNHLREMVVTHTGLQKGAIIELDYTITSEAGFYPLLMNREMLSKEIPVKNMEIKVDIPKDKTLNHQTTGIRTAPEINEKDARKQFTWKFSNLDAHPDEQYSPEPYQFLPMLEFSTGNIAKEMANFNQQVKETSEEFHSQMEEIRQITEPLPGDSNKVKTINQLYTFVKENINHYNISPEHYAYKPRPAEKILQSNGATNLEACRLLAKMLQYSGIDANLVYAYSHSSSQANNDLLSPAFPMVRVEHNRENLFLNPFRHLANNPLWHNSNLSVYYMDGTRAGHLLPVKKVRDNTFILSLDLKLDKKDNINGNAEIKLVGAFNPYYSFVLNQEKALKKLGDQLGLELSDADVTSELKQTTIQAKVDAGKLSEMADLKSFSLDKFSLKTQEINLSLISDKRQNPLDLDFPFTEKLDITLEIPSETEIIRESKYEHLHETLYSLFKYKINPGRNKVRVNRELTIDEARSSREIKYTGIKNFMLHTKKQDHNQILFE